MGDDAILSDVAKRKIITKKSYTPTKDAKKQKAEPKSNSKSPKTVEKSNKKRVAKKSVSPVLENQKATKKRVEKISNK